MADWIDVGSSPAGDFNGDFRGDPAMAADAIAAIRDPRERAQAQAAFESQLRSTGGKLPAFTSTAKPKASIISSAHADDGWQDVGDSTGNRDLKGPVVDAAKNAFGGIEAVGSMISGIPAYIASGLGGLAELARTGGDVDAAVDMQNRVADQKYHPQTDAGKLAEQGIGEGFEKGARALGQIAYERNLRKHGDPRAEDAEVVRSLVEGGTNLAANFLPLPGGKGVKALGKVIEKRFASPEIPKSKAAEVFDKKAAVTEDAKWQDVGAGGESAFNSMGAELVKGQSDPVSFPSTDPMAIIRDQLEAKRQGDVQAQLDARQAQMEQEVKRQQTLDFNAAERARQEAAPTGYQEHLQDQQGANAMAQTAHLLEIGDRDANAMRQQAQLDQAGTINVDPQGQAFRGDVNDPNARLGLERQGEAMDRELGPLAGKDTPAPGEPLRPLQDNFQMKEAAKAEWQRMVEEQGRPAENASRSYAETPISSKSKGGRQRGAIDLGVIKSLEKAFKDGKELLEGWRGAFNERAFNDLHGIINSNDPKAQVSFISPREFHTVADLRGKAEMADAPRLHERIRDAVNSKDGLYEVPELWVKVKDGVAKVVGHEGRHRMDVFRDMDVNKVPVVVRIKETDGSRPHTLQAQWTDNQAAQTVFPDRIRSGGGTPPLSQRGAVGLDLRKRVDDTTKKNNMAKNFSNMGLDEWDVIHNKDEALALAKDAKDITRDIGQKDLVSGINMETALTNNPLLKFGRTVMKEARAFMDGQSRKYITANDTGLSALWPKFKTEQRISLMEALMEADKRQMELTPDVMDALGFTDEMRQFAKTFREADEALLRKQNENAAKLGLEETQRRVGHFPGVFTGAYKAVVTLSDKPGGKHRAVAVVATDTKAQYNVAMENVKKMYPDAKFVEQKRGGLAGVSNRYYSDIFSGWNDVLNMLGREDPRFQEVTSLVDKAVLDANNRLFNFNVHELAKKGVIGNEGNKPWLSPKENADQAFKAMVRYFEEGFQHHALQVPLQEMREAITAPETDHMPNARNYLDKYIKKVTGDDLNEMGRALNTIIDQPFKFMPTVSWDKNKSVKFGMGTGPSVPLKLSGSLKNTMSQLYMGWFNYMFTAAQLVQPLQTGVPFMQTAAARIGASPMAVAASMGKGGIHFMTAFTESITGKKIEGLDQVHRDAFQYAKDRGMFEFSEIERAYQGTQGPISRAKDRMAEANMKIGEQMTRTPMFMAFVDLLTSKGMATEKAFPIAENLTQASMIDYHQWERPMIYSKMGVVGGFAAGLTTFKHGFVSQQVYLGKQAVSPVAGKRSQAALPLAYSVASMLAFAGITGLPFYSELDGAYRMLTNHLLGEEKSLREAYLQNSPEWLNSGAVSAATNMNLQSKFSSADMLPDADHKFRALSPHLEGAAKIAGSAIDMVQNNGDAQSVRNFATAATPSGWRGLPENALARDENNNLIGRDGLPAFQRSDSEWETRKWTGQRSQREAIERESVWDARQKERADKERLKSIHQEYERRIKNGTMDQDSQTKLQDEYSNRKGDVTELLNLWKKVAIDKTKTEKERLGGTPNTLRGYNRWEYYNK